MCLTYKKDFRCYCSRFHLEAFNGQLGWIIPLKNNQPFNNFIGSIFEQIFNFYLYYQKYIMVKKILYRILIIMVFWAYHSNSNNLVHNLFQQNSLSTIVLYAPIYLLSVFVLYQDNAQKYIFHSNVNNITNRINSRYLEWDIRVLSAIYLIIASFFLVGLFTFYYWFYIILFFIKVQCKNQIVLKVMSTFIRNFKMSLYVDYLLNSSLYESRVEIVQQNMWVLYLKYMCNKPKLSQTNLKQLNPISILSIVLKGQNIMKIHN